MTYSYNKRQLEKKKAKKKQDKQQRKEDRRNNTPSSLQEMIAYVDENGNLVDTPVEQTTVQDANPETEQTESKDTTALRVEGWVDSIDKIQQKGLIRTRYSMYRYAFDTLYAPQDLQAGDRVMFEIELADGDKIAVGVEHVKS